MKVKLPLAMLVTVVNLAFVGMASVGAEGRICSINCPGPGGGGCSCSGTDCGCSCWSGSNPGCSCWCASGCAQGFDCAS